MIFKYFVLLNYAYEKIYFNLRKYKEIFLWIFLFFIFCCIAWLLLALKSVKIIIIMDKYGMIVMDIIVQIMNKARNVLLKKISKKIVLI